MLRAYYRLWVDAIIYEQRKNKNGSNWKLMLLCAMSALQGLNLLVLLFIFRALSHQMMPILLPVKIFNVTPINQFSAIILTFFLPFVILNYLLIFTNNRYQALISVFPNKNGKTYRNYFIVSAGLIVIPLLIKFIF